MSSVFLRFRQLLELWNFKKRQKKNLMKRRMMMKNLDDYVSKLNGKKERSSGSQM